MLFLRIITVLFPIFSIVLIGYLYARWRPLDMAMANRVNLEVFTPALLITVLADQQFNLLDYWQLAVICVLIVLGSGLLSIPIARLSGANYRSFIPPMMFTNTGNIGLPLALFAFGDEGLKAAVVLFVVSNFLHFTIGMSMVNPYARWSSIWRNPIILASLIGIGLSLSNLHLPDMVMTTLKMLGDVSIPLMLFALGVRLIQVDLSDWKIGLIGAVWCPISAAIILLALLPFLQLPALQITALITFASLPPAVLNYMFAEQYQQQPQRVASLVMLGNLFSLISLPIALALAWRVAA